MSVHMVHTCHMHKLAQFLTTKGETHERFAKRLGVSRAHLTKIVNGTAYPSRKLMLRISEATAGGVPVTAWFEQPAE